MPNASWTTTLVSGSNLSVSKNADGPVPPHRSGSERHQIAIRHYDRRYDVMATSPISPPDELPQGESRHAAFGLISDRG
jgi:hypothetical protein